MCECRWNECVMGECVVMCDLEAMGDPSIFNIIRSVTVLTRMCPTLSQWRLSDVLVRGVMKEIS